MDSLLFLIKKHNNNKTAGIVILALANTTNKVSFQQTTNKRDSKGGKVRLQYSIQGCCV